MQNFIHNKTIGDYIYELCKIRGAWGTLDFIKRFSVISQIILYLGC